MITVRTYGNLADAGFAKSLLEAVGIRAELADEHSYALGCGPGAGGLRLQVEEADVERAQKVLTEGPDAVLASSDGAQREAPSLEPQAKGPRFPAGIFIAAGVAFLAILFAVAQLREKERTPNTAEQTIEEDYDNDGRADHFIHYRGNFVSGETVDRNGDGKIDEWQEFDPRGGILRIMDDNNFDGSVDVWFDYEKGGLKSGRFDFDFNGVPDGITDYKNGLPVRGEVKPNGSTKGARIQDYVHGWLREERVDSDGDGKPDYRITYDPFGDASERMPIQ